MARDIVLICGYGGSGKDFIVSKLQELFGYYKMVSFTTRPMREGEINGKSYYFISDSEFFKMKENNEFFEITEYETDTGKWYYGFAQDSIKEGEINLAIINPDGIDQMVKSSIKDRLVILYVDTTLATSIYRYNKRLGNKATVEQKAEGYNRILRDIGDFTLFDNDIVYDECGNELYKSVIPIISLGNDINSKLHKEIEWFTASMDRINSEVDNV